MSEETTKDVTKRALDAGWALSELTVIARLVDDEDTTPSDSDCYTDQDLAAWKRGDWSFCGVVVDVVDGDGRHWGASSLWGVHRGQFADTDAQGNVTGTRNVDPLTEDYPLSELIPEALNYAAEAISSFVLPAVIAPEDKRPEESA